MMLKLRKHAVLWSPAWLFLILVLSGCGGASPVKLQGEPTDAVGALDDALKEWQAGKKVEDLKDEDPQMIVRDEDWEAGAKLKAFEIKKDATKDGGNWRVEATLKLEGKGQPSTPKVAAYAVALDSKVISIQRKDHLE